MSGEYDALYNPDEENEDDIMETYRRKRIADTMMAPDDTESDAYKQYHNLIHSGAPSADILQNMEESRPDRQDYQHHSTGNKILAALAGFSAGMKDPSKGIQAAMNVRDQGYNRATDQWQQDNEGKIQNAKIQDAAYNQQLKTAGLGLSEERRNRGLKQRGEKDAASQGQRRLMDEQKIKEKQIEDTRKAAESQSLIKTRDSSINLKNTQRDRLIHPDKYQKSTSQQEPTAYQVNKELEAEDNIKARAKASASEELMSDPVLGSHLEIDKDNVIVIKKSLLDDANMDIGWDVFGKKKERKDFAVATIKAIKDKRDKMMADRMPKHRQIGARTPTKYDQLNVTVPDEDGDGDQ